jgi:hypothetical protein
MRVVTRDCVIRECPERPRIAQNRVVLRTPCLLHSGYAAESRHSFASNGIDFQSGAGLIDCK